MNGVLAKSIWALILITGCFFTGTSSVLAQGKNIKKSIDSLQVSVDYIRSENGRLYFKAQLSSNKKEKTTLFVRDQGGELVYQDKLNGSQIQKIYQIASDCSPELVFEWVRPQRILLKKFKVSREETSYVSVTHLN